MKRIFNEELLDLDRWSDAEVACALGAIGRINRFFGGNRMHKRLLGRIADKTQLHELHVLEVAAGRGDVLQAACKVLLRKGVSVQVSLLDRSAQHLPEDHYWKPPLPMPTLIAGDALSIPLPDRSVDVVSCCLFLHHLNDEDARAFLREALRVSRVAVIVNDLERRRAHLWLSRLATLMDPSWISRHDGPTSVRRAYTYQEAKTMLQETGCAFELTRGFLFRLGAILWSVEK